MKLLVDIGNHRLKWATSAQLEHGISASAADIQSMDISGPGFTDSLGALQESVGRPVAVWAASVAGEEVNQVLSAWVRAAWGLEVVFLSSTARACGIVNGYEQPGTLGVDRWAAIVAACERAPGESVLIIDAGTAVTIDYVG